MHMLFLFLLLARSLWRSSLSVVYLSMSPSMWCIEEVDLFPVAPPAATGDTETLLAGVGGDEIVGENEGGQLHLDGGDKRCDCLLVYIVVQWIIQRIQFICSLAIVRAKSISLHRSAEYRTTAHLPIPIRLEQVIVEV